MSPAAASAWHPARVALALGDPVRAGAALPGRGRRCPTAFLEPVYLGNILRQAAPVGIAAIGATLVMILGCVDLSIGAIISFAAVLCAVLMAGERGKRAAGRRP